MAADTPKGGTPGHGRCILVVNAGSSSVKFAAWPLAGAAVADRPAVTGQVSGLGTAPVLEVDSGAGAARAERPDFVSHAEALGFLLGNLGELTGGLETAAVGHRVVHGGTEFAAPVAVDGATLERLAGLTPLAPLHQPHNLAPIRALLDARPDLPQVACFDTAFHRSNPEVEQRMALPRRFWDAGVRRYGFHGLSYENVVRRLGDLDPALPGGRAVALHLGNGASGCAIRAGRGVTSTMGYTAVEGLPMGTRCGALDPGVVLHLIMREGLAPAEVERILYRESGLLGVSGISSDMRALLASGAAEAREAVELFVNRVVRETASLAAAMDGLDAVVFTGGIGEHASAVRAAVCERLGWLGLGLDGAANRAGATRISADGSRVGAYVVPAEEERVIAQHTAALLSGRNTGEPS